MNAAAQYAAAQQALADAEATRQLHLDNLAHAGRREATTNTLSWQQWLFDARMQLARYALDAEFAANARNTEGGAR